MAYNKLYYCLRHFSLKVKLAKLKESLNTIDWPTTFCGTHVNLYLDVTIDTVSEKCTMFVPQKQSKKGKVLMFHHEKNIKICEIRKTSSTN